MTVIESLGRTGQLVWDDFGRRADKVVVRSDPGTYVNVRLFTAFVSPGDTLIIQGELNCTNNTGRSLTTGAITGTRYAIGVATSLWIYDANAPTADRPATYVRLGTNGENCTPDDHHIQQGLTRPWVVPDTWDPTHQVGVILRVDAHSSGAGSNSTPDYLLIETHGVLMVQRTLAAPAADPGLAMLQTQVDALTDQVGVLTAAVAALTPQEG